MSFEGGQFQIKQRQIPCHRLSDKMLLNYSNAFLCLLSFLLNEISIVEISLSLFDFYCPLIYAFQNICKFAPIQMPFQPLSQGFRLTYVEWKVRLSMFA